MPPPSPKTILSVAASDPVLHHVAPLGLGAAAGTALVVDLDPGAPSYPGPTLAQLADEGLRREHLLPGRAGVAVVANGGADPARATEVVDLLAARWPAVVLRLPPAWADPAPIPVRALLPGPLAPLGHGPAVYQRISPATALPGPGIGLPPLSRAQVAAMLGGRIDPRWRWVRAWRSVWEATWR